jgi:hypothetical protein
MKKLVSLIISIVLSTASLMAQSIEKKWMLHLSSGPSFPIGTFGSKDDKDTVAGWAKRGFGGNIAVGYQFTDKLALFAVGGYSQYAQDNEPLKKQIQSTGNYTVHVRLDDWRVIKAMLGGSYRVPISNSSSFFSISKLMAGVSKTAIPKQSGDYYSTGPNIQAGSFQNSKVKLPLTFAYQFSTGLTYYLDHQFALIGELAFFNSNPVTKNQRIYGAWPYPSPGQPQPSQPQDQQYSLSSVNFSMALVIHL